MESLEAVARGLYWEQSVKAPGVWYVGKRLGKLPVCERSFQGDNPLQWTVRGKAWSNFFSFIGNLSMIPTKNLEWSDVCRSPNRYGWLLVWGNFSKLSAVIIFLIILIQSTSRARSNVQYHVLKFDRGLCEEDVYSNLDDAWARWGELTVMVTPPAATLINSYNEEFARLGNLDLTTKTDYYDNSMALRFNL